MACLALALMDARSQAAEELDPCLASKTDQELAGCRREALAASQARVDRIFGSLHETYAKDEPVKAGLLDESQSAWTRYRDAQCRLQTADSASGTAADLYVAACLTNLNDQRSGDLGRMADLP